MASSNKELLARVMALFQGSPRSFGRYFPGNGSVITEKAQYNETHFALHLRGETGIGLVPILDDNTCTFAVIDVDCHGEDAPEIDLKLLETKRAELKLPLVICRSKSGGAHCILFGSEPIGCASATQLLNMWAPKLGYAGSEIFPKQTRLVMSDGELQLGNWINLPYFACRNTDRYALGLNGEPLDFEGFLELAESRRQSRADIAELLGVDHTEAPPCFQRMLAQGVPDGFRNESLYHATIYFKRAFPNDWRDRAFQFNDEVLETPLPMVEAKKALNSAGRRDYKYKCNSEPCKSLCDRTVCLTRKFGITPSFLKDDKDAPQMPEITQIRVFKTDPPRYEITADGVVVAVSDDEFMKWPLLRFKLMHALSRNMPVMPAEVYENLMLSKYWEKVEVMSVPEDASPAGMCRQRLLEWLRKAKVATKPEERASVLLGLPVLTDLDGEQVYIFRGPAFTDHLRRVKAEDLRGAALWHALRELPGMDCRNVRIAKRPTMVWVVPAALTQDAAPDPKDFTTEF